MKRILAGAAFLGAACFLMGTARGRSIIDQIGAWGRDMARGALGTAGPAETVQRALATEHPETAMAAAFKEALSA